MRKIILEVDEANMVHDKASVYIGTITPANIVEYIESDTNRSQTTIALIKAGVSPEDIIQLSRNDLI